MKPPPIGLQLFSVRRAWTRDPLGTLRQLGALGYAEVELFFHDLDDRGRIIGLPAATLAAGLKESGLAVFASHLSQSPALDWDAMIEYNNVLGSSGLVLSAAFFERIADAYRLADWLNEKADLARRHGLDFYYHNHFHEFQELDGEAVMDVLLAQTNPATVRMETDVCWVSRAGLDPVEYLRRHGARTGALHVKDLARHARPVNLLAARPGHLTPDRVFSAAAPDDFVPVGSGSLDIAAVLAEALRLPSLRHLVIEQDESRDEIADAASGLRHVQGLLASAA